MSRYNYNKSFEVSVTDAGTSSAIEVDLDAELGNDVVDCALEVEIHTVLKSDSGLTACFRRRRRYNVAANGTVTPETDPAALISEIPLGLAGINLGLDSSARVIRGRLTCILGQTLKASSYINIKTSSYGS